MNKLKALDSIKYVYLIAFFALLAGLFKPLVSGSGLDIFISGIFVLFVGLTGTILVFKAITTYSRRGIYFGLGFGLIALSFAGILQLTNRF